MKTITLITLSLMSVLCLQIGSVSAQQKIDWNGYLQYRFTDNYLNQENFSVRRAKLWLTGELPSGSDELSYKLQTIFYNQQNYNFLIQDAYVAYKAGDIRFTAGQFVPDFSLQRQQSDYAIPLVERASVINSLIPSAETLGRDIGLGIQFAKKDVGGVGLGLFNGNGANTLSNEKNFLMVNRGYLEFGDTSDHFHVGYSLSYRDSKGLKFSKIFGSGFTFIGKDFRYGIEGKLNLSRLELQSEYISANLGGQRAWGYYVLADYMVTPKNLFALSVEKLDDLNPATSNDPWYVASYSHLFKGNDIKVTLDQRFQFTGDRTNSQTILQIQYFFNQD